MQVVTSIPHPHHLRLGSYPQRPRNHPHPHQRYPSIETLHHQGQTRRTQDLENYAAYTAKTREPSARAILQHSGEAVRQQEHLAPVIQPLKHK
jgi:hypothetical protein